MNKIKHARKEPLFSQKNQHQCLGQYIFFFKEKTKKYYWFKKYVGQHLGFFSYHTDMPNVHELILYGNCTPKKLKLWT